MSPDCPAVGAHAASADLGETLGGVDPRFTVVDDHKALRPLVAALPARERRILHLRLVEELNQVQIAHEVGVSQMHVSRLLAKIIAHLRVQFLAG